MKIFYPYIACFLKNAMHPHIDNGRDAQCTQLSQPPLIVLAAYKKIRGDLAPF